MILRHSGMIRAYDAIDVPQDAKNEAGASTPAVTHETVQRFRGGYDDLLIIAQIACCPFYQRLKTGSLNFLLSRFIEDN